MLSPNLVQRGNAVAVLIDILEDLRLRIFPGGNVEHDDSKDVLFVTRSHTGRVETS
jgi:hypothetical protein